MPNVGISHIDNVCSVVRSLLVLVVIVLGVMILFLVT